MKRFLSLLLMALLPGIAHGQTGFDPFGEARIDERPGALVPLDAPLLDEHGRPTSLRKIADGKPMLLAPVLHDCPNFCGVTLAGLTDAIAGQGLRPGKDFALVAFGLDPHEDPKAAAGDLSRMAARHAIGPATATTGPADSIHAVTDALGYRYAWDARIKQFAHVAGVAVLTPEGRLSGWLYGISPRPEAVTRAVAAARVEQPAPIGERLRLLCFHYDPATGRYTPAIDLFLKGAAFATVATVVVLLLRLRKSHG